MKSHTFALTFLSLNKIFIPPLHLRFLWISDPPKNNPSLKNLIEFPHLNGDQCFSFLEKSSKRIFSFLRSIVRKTTDFSKLRKIYTSFDRSPGTKSGGKHRQEINNFNASGSVSTAQEKSRIINHARLLSVGVFPNFSTRYPRLFLSRWFIGEEGEGLGTSETGRTRSRRASFRFRRSNFDHNFECEQLGGPRTD